MIYLNNLVVMKAVSARWGWIDGASREKRREERVSAVKSNCRQIVGLDNGLNGPYKPLMPPPPNAHPLPLHAYFCANTAPNLPHYNCEFHMQLIHAAVYLSINADIPG